MKANKRKIILICSSGGHLTEMLQLEAMFTKYDYLLVTEETDFTSFYKESYNMSFVRPRPAGKRRSLFFLVTMVVNFFLSIKQIARHYPKAIITTGSHTAVPMCLLGHLLGIKVVFILSYARINSRAKAADVIYPIADKFMLQWPGANAHYKKGIYVGGVY